MTAMHLVRTDRTWFLVAMGLALVLFFATLQTTINGSHSPYTWDTGEIQNALPRWGTIHWTGYPQYSLTGSLFVSLLRPLGIPPAAGASLVSAFWATVAVGLLVLLARGLGASMPAAVIGAWFVAVSTSVWMNASLAEVHTLTLVLTIASLLFAVRFGRTGKRRDLLLLTFAFTQGVVHQRAVVFLAPGIVVLITPQWRATLKHVVAVVSVALIAPLTYLYLPLRVQMGAKWTFGQIGSWHGLWVMLTDNKAERIIELPTNMNEWLDRARIVVNILNDDLPWSLLGLGLISLVLVIWSQSRREALGLTLCWVPYLALSLLIWEGRVGDAMLAAKLPILLFAGVGLALLISASWERLEGLGGKTGSGVAGALLLLVILAILVADHYPEIRSVTSDSDAEGIINIAEQVAPPADGQPTVMMALWGHDFWALAYAQTYLDRLPGLTLVDHNANLKGLIADGYRLWTPSKTFYVYPTTWWDRRLRQPVALSMISPDVVQVDTKPQTEVADLPRGPSLDLGNGIRIAYAEVSRLSNDKALITVVWQATEVPIIDYSVAVHLVANDPPHGPEDVLATSDRKHPVDGWYPTSRWTSGEVVTDVYLIDMVDDPKPAAVRVAMYHRDDDGSFVNSSWLSLPLQP